MCQLNVSGQGYKFLQQPLFEFRRTLAQPCLKVRSCTQGVEHPIHPCTEAESIQHDPVHRCIAQRVVHAIFGPEVHPAMAVGAQRDGIFDSIIAVIDQRYLVMHFQVRLAVSPLCKRCKLLAAFAPSSGSFQNRRDDIRTAFKGRGSDRHTIRLFGRRDALSNCARERDAETAYHAAKNIVEATISDIDATVKRDATTMNQVVHEADSIR